MSPSIFYHKRGAMSTLYGIRQGTKSTQMPYPTITIRLADGS